MIHVSDAWKATLNRKTNYTTSATILLADGSVISITPAEVSLNTNRFTDGPGLDVFPVGTALSRTMQLELINADERYSAVSFTDAVIRLSLNYGAESISIGTFTVRRPATYGETVIITAQDDMYKADRPFSTSLAFPTTAWALWQEMCATCNITNGMSSLPAYTIDAAPSAELTFRAVFGYIAMLFGGNARINRAGALQVVYYDFTALDAERIAETAENIHDLTAWRSLHADMEDVTITGVKTGETTVGQAGYMLELENPLFSGHETAALNAIGAALIGGRFRRFSGEYIAYPIAEFGDGARVTDRKGNVFYTILTDVGFTWSAPTSLSTSAEAPLENRTKYVGPSVRAIQEAAKMVEAEKTAREQAVQDLADALAAAGGMYITTETAPGGGTIYYLHDKPDLSDSMIILKLTAEALGISTDGGQTYPTGWNFATGTTITNILQTIGINADWINAGALTVRDGSNNIIFQADKDARSVQIGGWTADADSLTSSDDDFDMSLGNGSIVLSDGTHTARLAPMGVNSTGLGIAIHLPDKDSTAGTGISIDAGQSDVYTLMATPQTLYHNFVGDLTVGSVGTSYGIYVNGESLLGMIGTLANLNTSDKTSLVAAINEVLSGASPAMTARFG